MPNPAVAIPAVAVGSAVISSSAASRDSKRAAAADKAALAFEQEKYDDWMNVYGDIQSNLGKYYNSLTPEYYEAVGLEAFKKERQTAMKRLDEQFAQAGISPRSGVALSIKSQNEMASARNRADIRRSAPSMAAEEKRQFLQVGLGQNPGAGVGTQLSNQAIAANQRAAQSSQAAGQAMSSAVSTVGTALGDYFAQQDTTTTTTS